MSIDWPDNLEFKFDELTEKINESTDTRMRLEAQGVKVLRLLYPPRFEKQYLDELRETYPDQALIDLSDLFVKLIDDYGIDTFQTIYEGYEDKEKVFRSDYEDDPDLLDYIIEEIEQAGEDDKIPFLIRTGILYGTGIEVNEIVEHSVVNDLDKPLVIFYPARETEGDPLFLNRRSTSDYRGSTI